MHLKQGACPQDSEGRLLMPKGRTLRCWFVFAGLLMTVPYVAGQHDGDTRRGSEPRLKTSKPFYVEQVAISHATLSEQGGSDAVRTALNTGSCAFESTHTDADFEGPGMFSILFGFAQTEIAAASYVIDPAFFPIRVERVEMVFAQTGLEDKTTELKLLIFKGTPDQGQLVEAIEHTLDFPNCGDGLFCNGIEICADGGCASVLPPCFGQLCDEANDTCVECFNGASCQDGIFCNGVELCQGGACVDGSDPCNVEQLCDEAGQQCVVGECLADSDCSNGDFCDGPRICVANMCVDGPLPCAPEDCNEDTNQCACAADVDCDDGNPCTTDTCPAKVVCVFTESSCTDGDPCTVDSCNRANGLCIHDDVPCAADEQCHPNSGDCVECLSDGDCDDQLACSGTETCVGGSCLPGSMLCPDQLCDEGSESCFDRSCSAVNVVIDGLDVLVENNDTDTFSVAFQIVSHNDPSDNPCLANPPANNNVFPTVDVSGVSDDQNNWMNVLNCGPFDCPPGWRTFDDLALCEPDGDWVLRACWSPNATPLFGACCFDDGTCQGDIADVTCTANEGVFQGEDSICEPNPCPPPSEACCFPKTEGCIDMDPEFCTGLGKEPGGFDTTCETFTCFPRGACCKPNGFCVDDTSLEECEQTLLGTYQGDDTTCAQTTCPDPVGACCFSGESCLVLTEFDCAQGGATWHGPLTDCTDSDQDGLPDVCQVPPIGACCLPDFTCADGETSDGCAAAGGAYQGTGILCQDIEEECVAPSGACCLPDGECQIISEAGCNDVGGTYQDDGSNCTACQTQACCFEGAGCLDFPEPTCKAAGGNPQGAGTTCATVICPQPEGACCFETGLCLDLTLIECATGGASWQGADVSCSDVPDPCGAATGACCLEGGGCEPDQSEAACTVLGGTYQGDLTDCASADCPSSTGACCSFDGACVEDQTVDECAAPDEDYLGDGSDCSACVTGACCSFDGNCVEDRTVGACDAVSGDYLGDGSDCSTCVTEACCAEGNCTDLLPLPCKGIFLGEPQGPGTECATTECLKEGTGACCEIDGSCNVVLEADCIAGTYQDDGITCAQAECCQSPADCDDNDACNGQETCTDNSCADGLPLVCDDGSECTDDSCEPAIGCVFSEIDCDDGDDCTTNDCDPGNGCFHDPIVPCCGNGKQEEGEECDPPDDVTCDEACLLLPIGACCLITGNCQEGVSNNACINAGGTWQGEGADCAPDLCPECTPGDGAAENDCCADMIPIFTGSTAFDTNNANTDGPPHDECKSVDQTHHDIWYDHLADCSGNVTVTTCEDLGGSADYDTKLVIYDGCDCDALTLIDCNDDDPDHACGEKPDFHSTVTFPAVAENCYLIRIGGFNTNVMGTGSLFIECVVSCPADINGDGEVNPIDLATLLGSWGPCPKPCTPGDPADTCGADFNGDCEVNPIDLATLLGSWGPCP